MTNYEITDLEPAILPNPINGLFHTLVEMHTN